MAIVKRQRWTKRVFMNALIGFIAGTLAAYFTIKVNAAAASGWMKIHNCEQPGSWTTKGTYQGGLGIWYGNWDKWSTHFKVHYIWPDAGDAPPSIQITIADWAYRHDSPTPYWGCFATVGRP